jgi:hypothetical protein
MHPGAENGIRQGADVPFTWPVTVDLILTATFLSDPDKEAILSGSLMTLPGIAS